MDAADTRHEDANCSKHACSICGFFFDDESSSEWRGNDGSLGIVAETNGGEIKLCERCYRSGEFEQYLQYKGVTKTDIANIHCLFALEYNSLDRYEDASRAGHNSLRIKVTTDALNILAVTYSCLGDHRVAAVLLEQVLAVDPENFSALQNMWNTFWS